MHTDTRDGIDYTRVVTPDGSGFWATWTCQKCSVSGEIAATAVSEETAVGRAKAHLFTDHHVPKHYLAAKSSGVK